MAASFGSFHMHILFHGLTQLVVRLGTFLELTFLHLTILKNHAKDIWPCDFLPVIDAWFRPLYLFFVVELASQRVVHFGVTRSPTHAWVALQLREATPFGQEPRS